MKRKSILSLSVFSLSVFSVAIFSLGIFGASALAQSNHDGDEAKIRQRLVTYSDARNHGDAHAEALCYTEDADFRSVGPARRGRAEIEKALAVSVPEYVFSLTVETVRFLDSNVAIVDTHVITGPPQHKVDMLGAYILVKQGSDWLISAARIARTATP
jgi:uncharacterized protein (TIGR02246 family)